MRSLRAACAILLFVVAGCAKNEGTTATPSPQPSPTPHPATPTQFTANVPAGWHQNADSAPTYLAWEQDGPGPSRQLITFSVRPNPTAFKSAREIDAKQLARSSTLVSDGAVTLCRNIPARRLTLTRFPSMRSTAESVFTIYHNRLYMASYFRAPAQAANPKARQALLTLCPR